MKTIVISRKAFCFMYQAIQQSSDAETGGILLGYDDEEQSTIKIIETIDGGPNAVHSATGFRYDQEYVEHLSTLVSGSYNPPLVLIGVWHVHLNNFMPPFSHDDDEMHAEACRCMGKDWCVSLLTQLQDEELYNTNLFIVNKDGHCEEYEFDIIDNNL